MLIVGDVVSLVWLDLPETAPAPWDLESGSDLRRTPSSTARPLALQREESVTVDGRRYGMTGHCVSSVGSD